jgi:hypothetical protein
MDGQVITYGWVADFEWNFVIRPNLKKNTKQDGSVHEIHVTQIYSLQTRKSLSLMRIKRKYSALIQNCHSSLYIDFRVGAWWRSWLRL